MDKNHNLLKIHNFLLYLQRVKLYSNIGLKLNLLESPD